MMKTVLLTSTGELWSCGRSYQFDRGQTHTVNSELAKIQIPEPVIAVRCGYSIGLAVGMSGQLYGWGENHK